MNRFNKKLSPFFPGKSVKMEPDQHLHLQTSSEEEGEEVQETPKKKDRPQQEVPTHKLPGNITFARMVKEQFYVLGVDNRAEQKIITRFLRKHVPPDVSEVEMKHRLYAYLRRNPDVDDKTAEKTQFIRLKPSDWDLSKMTPEEERQYNYPTISDPSVTAEDAYAARPWLSGIPDYENDDVETHSPVSKTAEKWVETYKRKDDD